MMEKSRVVLRSLKASFRNVSSNKIGKSHTIHIEIRRPQISASSHFPYSPTCCIAKLLVEVFSKFD